LGHKGKGRTKRLKNFKGRNQKEWGVLTPNPGKGEEVKEGRKPFKERASLI